VQKNSIAVLAPASSSCLAASAETVLAFVRAVAKSLRLAVAMEAVLPIGKGDGLTVSFVFSDDGHPGAADFRQIISAVEKLATMTTQLELTRVLGVAAGDMSLASRPTTEHILGYLTPEAAAAILGRQVPESAQTQLELESESL